MGQALGVECGREFDWSWLKRNSFSPRVAVIYKPAPKTDLKLLFSRGFRNPSSYDMFWTDDGMTAIANPSLRPETSDTYEFDFDREVTRRVRIGASLYHYRVHDPDRADLYRQRPDAVRERRWRPRLGRFARIAMPVSGLNRFEIQHRIPARVFSSGSVLPNSPGQVGKLRLSMPLWRERVRRARDCRRWANERPMRVLGCRG